MVSGLHIQPMTSFLKTQCSFLARGSPQIVPNRIQGPLYLPHLFPPSYSRLAHKELHIVLLYHSIGLSCLKARALPDEGPVV